MIYVIRCEGTWLRKIGVTTRDPWKRLESLQTGSASKLTLELTAPGGRAAEQRLHRQFGVEREHGEWFRIRISDLMALSWIQFQPVPLSAPPVYSQSRLRTIDAIQRTLEEMRPAAMAALRDLSRSHDPEIAAQAQGFRESHLFKKIAVLERMLAS